jgi:hypothetical protein
MNEESIITVGRVLLVIYLIAVTIVAILLPFGDRSKHFLALRHLGQNTRIHKPLLVKPPGLSLEDHFWLDRELKELEGKYLSRDVLAEQPITLQDVKAWPELKREEAIPVEFEPEPDWVSLNQGSFVQVWVDNQPISERAYVLAIVPSGSRWLALLRKNDLSKVVSSKEPLKLRLDTVAGK